MSLEAPKGALIVVNPLDKDLIDKRLYVFKNGSHEATFKRYRCSDGPVRLEPCSHNDVHQTIFPHDELRVVGRVVQIIREV